MNLVSQGARQAISIELVSPMYDLHASRNSVWTINLGIMSILFKGPGISVDVNVSIVLIPHYDKKYTLTP